jgi:hypothetical protein
MSYFESSEAGKYGLEDYFMCSNWLNTKAHLIWIHFSLFRRLAQNILLIAVIY